MIVAPFAKGEVIAAIVAARTGLRDGGTTPFRAVRVSIFHLATA
jgi:hypothetical protein